MNWCLEDSNNRECQTVPWQEIQDQPIGKLNYSTRLIHFTVFSFEWLYSRDRPRQLLASCRHPISTLVLEDYCNTS